MLLLGCTGNGSKTASDKFADHVRTTDFQTPEEEMAGFKLPPGFEITLFASEPELPNLLIWSLTTGGGCG